jgi:F0F1-type ATP synthase assembly protein I
MNNSYLKYSNMAFQMGAIIAIFTFAGYKLDEHFKLKTPYCTIILSLTGVGASLYSVLRDFMKPDK